MQKYLSTAVKKSRSLNKLNRNILTTNISYEWHLRENYIDCHFIIKTNASRCPFFDSVASVLLLPMSILLYIFKLHLPILWTYNS